ncbi:MAG: DUF5687 family protein [Leeuwenhoekiella sp.]
MLKHFISLQWKSFVRSASFKTNLILKILMVFGALYFIALFLGAGFILFYGLKKNGMEPLATLNKYLIYVLVVDLLFRYFFQKMPVMNIQPLLTLPIKKNKIVNFALGKTAVSYFNLLHAFFFIPFSVILLIEGYSVLGVICWHLGILCLIYINNFVNVFLNDLLSVVLVVGGIIGVLGAAQYYGYFDVTEYTQPFFQALYETYWMWLIPLVVMLAMLKMAHSYFLNRLYLDAGLAKKQDVATTENLDWLERFGRISTFLKSDIKLLKRNKRSKTTIYMSIGFLFYGLLFFTGAVEVYDNPFFKVFAGIFVTGGFLFSFGQFVPSWDSSYYPLMMTQNISYKEYLNSKWWLIVIATALSTVIGAFYLFFGWEAYAAIVVGGIYNIGVNGHVVLLGGAFIKTPIDLTSNKKAFGDKSAFNVKTLLITLPKLLLPIALYAAGHFISGPVLGFSLVALAGVAGFALKDLVFDKIIKIYKAEKYETLAAYKQKN